MFSKKFPLLLLNEVKYAHGLKNSNSVGPEGEKVVSFPTALASSHQQSE